VDVDLDPDRAGGDAVEGEGSGRGEHGNDATEADPTCYALSVELLSQLTRISCAAGF
jgi:hypothetical protein